LRTLMSKRLTLTGTVLRSRPPEEKMALARAFEEQVLPAFSAGRLKAVVDSVFSVDEIRMAFAKMQRNDSFGKIVVRW
ncbi:MAG TPA: zinc-binding dehydrogenase, partial [Myxococcales bacterium]